jgi:hypothetical protein
LTKYTPKSSTHLILPETHLKHGYIRLENRPYAEVSISKFNQIFLVRHQRSPANDKAHDEESEVEQNYNIAI